MKTLSLWIIHILNIVLIETAVLDDSCGQTNLSPFWKWNVQLLNIQYQPVHALRCGGTLLNKLFVATIAHCLYDINGDPIDKNQLQILLADGNRHSISRTFQPEPFDVEQLNNDYALLLLDQEVTFNNLVGAICLPETNTILPQNVYTTMSGDSSFSATDGSTCLRNMHTLFRMIYSDAICLGDFDETHEYHRNAGGGMYVAHNSSWYLMGIVMYATGPSKVHVTYVGGVQLERHLNWTRRIVRHYSENMSLSEKNCQNNLRDSNNEPPEFHPTVNLVNQGSWTICHASLISPGYVLTTRECAMSANRVFIHHGNDGGSDWFTVKAVSTEGPLALIALDRDVRENSEALSCLYTSITPASFNFTTRIAHDNSFARLEGIQVQYQVGKPLKVQYYCSRYRYRGHFTSRGDALFSNENRKVIGILINVLHCESFDYFYERMKTVEAVNVENYLPWIEEVVWGLK
ncbi:uncharacterized protein LOC134214902 [Armigeres subalbatus]|uniref:uncharacterized protein LOC134214902 n=1 Tax=Armigeres subalbatus TaxID=124917 RepID=UPI002ED16DA4